MAIATGVKYDDGTAKVKVLSKIPHPVDTVIEDRHIGFGIARGDPRP